MYTVLHLEQSEFIKKMIRNILNEKGFVYYSADTAAEAYDILDNNNIELIITSMLIADEDIESFVKTINRSDYKEIPIFVITGNEIAEDKKRILNLGVSDYITKDKLLDELLKHIEVVLKEDELTKCLKEASVAVVDDSNFESEVIKDILINNEIKNVDCYESGKDLLQSDKSYDLYLIDVVLENEFGRNIVMQVRRNNINASIVVVSSLTNTKTLASILNSGADDYIRKPVQEEIFIAKLRANMRSHAAMK